MTASNRFAVELIGGPKDGERMIIMSDLPTIRVTGYGRQPENWSTDPALAPVEVTLDYYEYVRTKRVNDEGYRIYAFSELARK